MDWEVEALIYLGGLAALILIVWAGLGHEPKETRCVIIRAIGPPPLR